MRHAAKYTHTTLTRTRERNIQIRASPLTVTKRPPHRRAARSSSCILRGERWHARARSGRGASRTSCAQAAPRQRAHARARGDHINTRAARQITRVQRALLLRITTMVHVHAWIMIRRLCASQATRKNGAYFGARFRDPNLHPQADAHTQTTNQTHTQPHKPTPNRARTDTRQTNRQTNKQRNRHTQPGRHTPRQTDMSNG